jgi:hypothetical protein
MTATIPVSEQKGVCECYQDSDQKVIDIAIEAIEEWTAVQGNFPETEDSSQTASILL